MTPYRIEYVTGTDGWGDEPTDDDAMSFCALVEARVTAMYPGRIVETTVDPGALESKVRTDDPEIDPDELRQYIGNDVWADWCAGERVGG